MSTPTTISLIFSLLLSNQASAGSFQNFQQTNDARSEIPCGSSAAFLLARALGEWESDFAAFDEKTRPLSSRNRHSLLDVKKMLELLNIPTVASRMDPSDFPKITGEPFIAHIDGGNGKPGHFVVVYVSFDHQGQSRLKVVDPYFDSVISIESSNLGQTKFSGAILKRSTRRVLGTDRQLLFCGLAVCCLSFLLAFVRVKWFQRYLTKRHLLAVFSGVFVGLHCGCDSPTITDVDVKLGSPSSESDTVHGLSDYSAIQSLEPQPLLTESGIESELFKIVEAPTSINVNGMQRTYFEIVVRNISDKLIGSQDFVVGSSCCDTVGLGEPDGTQIQPGDTMRLMAFVNPKEAVEQFDADLVLTAEIGLTYQSTTIPIQVRQPIGSSESVLQGVHLVLPNLVEGQDEIMVSTKIIALVRDQQSLSESDFSFDADWLRTSSLGQTQLVSQYEDHDKVQIELQLRLDVSGFPIGKSVQQAQLKFRNAIAPASIVAEKRSQWTINGRSQLTIFYADEKIFPSRVEIRGPTKRFTISRAVLSGDSGFEISKLDGSAFWISKIGRSAEGDLVASGPGELLLDVLVDGIEIRLAFPISIQSI